MIRSYSYIGDPPLWEMEIHLEKNTVLIRFPLGVASMEEHRQAVSELGSVLQMRLHEIVRECAKEEK